MKINETQNNVHTIVIQYQKLMSFYNNCDNKSKKTSTRC